MPRQTVSIEKLVFGGVGLARTDKGIVFVSDVAPGETVEIEMTGKKGGAVYARPVKIVKPSPARHEPACPLYGRCGGCDWLHIIYKEQAAIKKEIFLDCMRRIGRIENLPSIEVAAAEEFGYRQRAQLKIDNKGNAGFFARQTNDVVPIRRCPLLVDALNGLLNEIADRTIALPCSVKNLTVIAGDDNAIASWPVIAGRTSRSVAITAGNRTFEVQAGGFFQSNRSLLERLGSWAKMHVGGERCIDLYGGSGFFSLMLAEQFKKGLLIESVNEEVMTAHANFGRNRIKHLKAMRGDAENLLWLAGTKPLDCLIVDPPRSGLTPKVRTAVAALKPKTILYVSCNPSTQARDTGFLVNSAGYTIAHAALFDLYPNTHHIETLLVLKKR
jgi:23S rRNA (uracil1939-C5)-methyltransferase